MDKKQCKSKMCGAGLALDTKMSEKRECIE
jgi:hypothetical protein